MKIKKIFQGQILANKILNANSNSQTDTYSCDYINKSKNVYSTQEQVIGTWIDGKPLYRITISKQITNTGTSTTLIDLKTLNVDLLTDIKGILKLPNNAIVYHNSYFSSNELNWVYQQGDKVMKILMTNASYSGATTFITIEYTKTTD